jgi:hypothetical protein
VSKTYFKPQKKHFPAKLFKNYSIGPGIDKDRFVAAASTSAAAAPAAGNDPAKKQKKPKRIIRTGGGQVRFFELNT